MTTLAIIAVGIVRPARQTASEWVLPLGAAASGRAAHCCVCERANFSNHLQEIIDENTDDS